MAQHTDGSETAPKRLRVLFMHGLESGPGGNKDRYLRRHFDVLTPDMHVSIYRLTKSNSVIRHVFRRPLFLGWVTIAVAALLCGAAWHGPLAWLAWLVVFASVLATMRKRLVSQALAASLERSVAIQAAAIREYHPDIIVGSSWGGAVALICASREIHTGPLLAIAPVPKLILDRIGDADGRRWTAFCRGISAKAARRMLIVHGSRDETVPVDDSRAFAAATGATLEVIPGGDHSLNNALIYGDDGDGANDRLRQLVVETAMRQ